MSVDHDTVKRIARLARIAEPEEEIDDLVRDLNGILNWVEQLNELSTDDIPPMTSAVELDLPRREDVVSDGGYPSEVVANAKESDDNYFSVPKVVE